MKEFGNKGVAGFSNVILDFGIRLQPLAYPDKASSVFFNIASEIECLDKEFVPNGRTIVVPLEIRNGKLSEKPAGTGDDNPFIKNLDYDV